MKKGLVIVLFFAFCISCQKETESSDKFTAFVKTIPDLKLPFKTNSNKELQTKYIVDTTYSEFIDDSANGIYGKLTVNDSIYGLVFLNAGDIVFPQLTTFNKTGKKIDELSLLHLPGGSDGYNANGISFLDLNQNFEIQITDTVHSFERDSIDEIIEASRKTEIVIDKYKVGSDGKIGKKD